MEHQDLWEPLDGEFLYTPLSGSAATACWLLITIKHVLFGKEPHAVHQRHLRITSLCDGQGEVPEGIEDCRTVTTIRTGQGALQLPNKKIWER